MEDYKILETLGSGSFGTVYKAQNKQTGEIVAVKEFKKVHNDAGDVQAFVIREVSILQKLSCRTHSSCIARFKDIIHRGSSVYMVMEYMESNLLKYIKGSPSISRDNVKYLMYQLCKGLAFIHGTGVLHRDLKPDNILINNRTMKLRIADFGQARRYTLDDQSYSPQRGAFIYRAPEILSGVTKYSTEVDIWSLGCIFAELVNGQPLFLGRSLPMQMELIKRLLDEGKNLEKAVRPLKGSRGMDLIKKMLCYTGRISAKEAMEHPYFNSVDKTKC